MVVVPKPRSFPQTDDTKCANLYRDNIYFNSLLTPLNAFVAMICAFVTEKGRSRGHELVALFCVS